MGNKIEYQVVTHIYLDSFEREVKRLLSEGWVCLGGVSVARDPWRQIFLRGPLYCQAMIRPDPSAKAITPAISKVMG